MRAERRWSIILLLALLTFLAVGLLGAAAVRGEPAGVEPADVRIVDHVAWYSQAHLATSTRERNLATPTTRQGAQHVGGTAIRFVAGAESDAGHVEGAAQVYDSPRHRYATNTATGGARVAQLGDDVALQVDEAIERAATGTTRFPGHDGKPFLNVDEALPAADAGYYTEWTAAASGAKRGTDRVIIGGSPAAPAVIFYWDHVGTYIQVYP